MQGYEKRGITRYVCVVCMCVRAYVCVCVCCVCVVCIHACVCVCGHVCVWCLRYFTFSLSSEACISQEAILACENKVVDAK